ncbi:hypothetical protein [Halorussus halobius]|uniref:hypothetical protein n=1 Tax=Halorussus halobius TaxID=1710537 RepID=UPI001091BBC3|nr:hypothetical protein [Halorussus halobius]
MISVRFVAMASTFFLVTGALLVGDALHGSVVTGQYPITSPAAVLRAVPGLICIALGYRLRTPPSEYAAVASDETGDEATDSETDPVESGAGPAESETADFDPQMSPLSDDQFEDLDADDE